MKRTLSIVLLLSFALSLSAQCNKTLTGQINVIDESAIRNIQVDIYVDGTPVATNYIDEDLSFSVSLADVPANSAYTVEITATSPNPLNGVSTLDMVFIQRHILGIQSFEKSSDLIVGDINCDGVISAVDMVHMRRLILGVDTNFVGGDYCFITTNGSLTDRTCNSTSDETLIIEAYKKGNVSE